LQLKRMNLPRNLELITCSQSDYVKATKSSLYGHKQIYKLILPVDEKLFFPDKNRDLYKSKYGIDDSTDKIILFGALSLHEKRKGFEFLLAALHGLKELLSFKEREKVHLIIMGRELKIGNLEIPFGYTFLGYIAFANLYQVFQMADVFVSPSIEDSGPIMINQSLMCGTPVVSFDIGVAMDLVLNDITGIRVPVKDTNELASGLYKVLFKDSSGKIKMRENCRCFALEKFGYKASKKIINSILGEDTTIT